jgi:25S rRNA (uracil2634-N3)-methyltransferase
MMMPAPKCSSSSMVVVAAGSLVSSGASRSRPSKLGEFAKHERVLFVGEGNFSFSANIVGELGNGANVVATNFDSRQATLRKYEESAASLRVLSNGNAAALFNVDATALHECQALSSLDAFDKIVFNFPHTGGATGKDVVRNCDMLSRFFGAAQRLLRCDTAANPATILVALRKTSFYDSWNIGQLAQAQGLRVARKTPFRAATYGGYAVARTSPAALRDAPSTDNAFYWHFAPTKKQRAQRQREAAAQKREENGDGEKERSGSGSDSDESDSNDDFDVEELAHDRMRKKQRKR